MGWASEELASIDLGDTRLVYVADPEADILDLMVDVRDLGTPTEPSSN